MTCREIADFLMEYLDDALAREVTETFEAHLGACRECVDYVETYRRTIMLGQDACDEDDAPDAPDAPDVPDRLIDVILAARRE